MGLFNFAKNAGERIGDAMTDNFFVNMFKGDDDDKDAKVDASDIRAERQDDRIILKGKARNRKEAEKIIIAAGNHEGIGEVKSHIEIEDTAAPEAKFYEVKSGDTLSKIAKEYYGDAMKYPQIFDANRPMLKDPDEIYPGQVLRIPPEDAAGA